MDGGTDQEVRNIYNSTQWSRAGGATAAEFVVLSDKGHQRDNQWRGIMGSAGSG